MIKKLRLAAEYACFPLWWDDGAQFGDLDPRELPISSQLQQALMDWSEQFDAIYNLDDPATSSFRNLAAERLFAEQGLILAQQLQTELGCDYHICYSYRVGNQD
ncbi:hypothetical protein [Herpetosiphon gulosus]|uniref:Uncharacterized protein n=1 Tax=Herpetosiphon gulosus TaxID=1973496 RepID=A0ABP9WYG2_9CHLR